VRARRLLAYAAAQLEAVEPRHHPVDDRQRRGGVAGDVAPRGAAVVNHGDLEALTPQRAAQDNKS